MANDAVDRSKIGRTKLYFAINDEDITKYEKVNPEVDNRWSRILKQTPKFGVKDANRYTGVCGYHIQEQKWEDRQRYNQFISSKHWKQHKRDNPAIEVNIQG
eukprot:446236_1